MTNKKNISASNLLGLIKTNNVTILDVRDKTEFENGYIFGSINIPVDELQLRLHEITQNKPIVTYCGKGGGRSENAANILIENSQQASWLEGGYTEWSSIFSKIEKDLIFHQLFEKDSSSYTYLLADPDSLEAIIIDPVLETVERDLKLISELNLKLLYIFETHIHADHITGSSEIKKRTGAKSAVSKNAGVCCADIELIDNQKIQFGRFTLKVLETPGHTNESLSFQCETMVFTGDSLMIRGTGRTDFQNGSASELYESIKNKLLILPNEIKIYPSHDYNGQLYSTIELEKNYNPRVGKNKSKDEFEKIMSELKLSPPKKIMESVAANLVCGFIASI